VWFQEFSNPLDAIAMEKHIKKMSRAQKETLIRTINPAWNFIGEE
jgi:predicted GIY-YIG superfamily endonuclease